MEDTALEHLENTIMVLKTMNFGNSFGLCRTEKEALESAIIYLDRIKDIYLEIQERKRKYHYD